MNIKEIAAYAWTRILDLFKPKKPEIEVEIEEMDDKAGEERQENVFHAGVLYITNQRIIFQAKENGFDKSFKYLTAFVPYSNGIELQFGNKSYTLLLQDGAVVNQTIQLIKQRRSSY